MSGIAPLNRRTRKLPSRDDKIAACASSRSTSKNLNLFSALHDVYEMSSFASKRKARVIKVSDDDGSEGSSEASADAAGAGERLAHHSKHAKLTLSADTIKPSFGAKSGRKPFRQSGLRKAFTLDDGDGTSGDSGQLDEADDGPIVVRPNAAKQKKKAKPKLRLGDDSEDADTEELAGAKKVPFGQRVLENTAVKRGIALRTLQTWANDDNDDDDDTHRPKYSKEYLEELQSSTPSTPRDMTELQVQHGDEMELDESELEGAMIVDSPQNQPTTQILSEAEIREKKERRSRLAKEQEFLSVEDSGDEFSKKKDEGRLRRDDEDLGEGFDDYVEDGGLSLGKRAQKERNKREKQQMAELINAAEGQGDDSSSDSDAERRMAYEAAQSRAGLDGLKKPKISKDSAPVPQKIMPVPTMAQALARLEASLKAKQAEMRVQTSRLTKSREDREDIDKRQAELQTLLDETGKKYQESMGHTNAELEMPAERGLDSFGTPQRDDGEDMDTS